MQTITVAFKDKVLVITGGTGSFGSTVLKHFLTLSRVTTACGQSQATDPASAIRLR